LNQQFALPTPLVSIVVDNYNYAQFLGQSIDSALAQTYGRVEVIVVDDASTDDSRAIIARYADRVMAILQPVNRGQGGAFNAGYAASRGDIVMFLDADDWLYPQAAERVVAAWVPGESKTHFRLDLVGLGGVPIDVHPAMEVRMDSGDVVPLLYEAGRYETVVTTGNAFARAALATNMPMPEEEFRMAADGYLATVVPFHGPVITIEECLGAYRVHGGNDYAAGTRRESVAAICARTRRRLAHDLHKDSVLRAKAASVGVKLEKPPYMRDSLHLELRLASLRLDPAGHPYPQDRRLDLMLRGVAASGGLRLSWARRVLMAGWFLLVGLSPRALATLAIAWKMVTANRPATIDRSLKMIRRVLR
jgi:glycosyltransferase involved in cell wall biosynthesis